MYGKVNYGSRTILDRLPACWQLLPEPRKASALLLLIEGHRLKDLAVRQKFRWLLQGIYVLVIFAGTLRFSQE
jgi:hypothetical protein